MIACQTIYSLDACMPWDSLSFLGCFIMAILPKIENPKPRFAMTNLLRSATRNGVILKLRLRFVMATESYPNRVYLSTHECKILWLPFHPTCGWPPRQRRRYCPRLADSDECALMPRDQNFPFRSGLWKPLYQHR